MGSIERTILKLLRKGPMHKLDLVKHAVLELENTVINQYVMSCINMKWAIRITILRLLKKGPMHKPDLIKRVRSELGKPVSYWYVNPQKSISRVLNEMIYNESVYWESSIVSLDKL
jgi:DNA-binding PadR family transcriptional regulator